MKRNNFTDQQQLKMSLCNDRQTELIENADDNTAMDDSLYNQLIRLGYDPRKLPLSKEREEELCIGAMRGEQECILWLTAYLLKFCLGKVIPKYARNSEDKYDLMQEIGAHMMDYLKKYDALPYKTARFTVYATGIIEQEFLALSRGGHKEYEYEKHAKEQLEKGRCGCKEHNVPETPENIAKYSDTAQAKTIRRYIEAEKLMNRQLMTEEEMQILEESGKSQSLIDPSVNTESEAIEHMLLDDITSTLDDMETHILNDYFLNGHKKKELCKTYGLTSYELNRRIGKIKDLILVKLAD